MPVRRTPQATSTISTRRLCERGTGLRRVKKPIYRTPPDTKAGPITLSQISKVEGSGTNITVTPKGPIAQPTSGSWRSRVIARWVHLQRTIHTTRRKSKPGTFVTCIVCNIPGMLQLLTRNTARSARIKPGNVIHITSYYTLTKHFHAMRFPTHRSFVLAPALLSYQRNEDALAQYLHVRSLRYALNELQILPFLAPHWQHQHPTHRQLLQEVRGDSRSRRRHQNTIVWSSGGPAEGAIGNVERDILDIELRQAKCGEDSELLVAFDAIHVRGQAGEDGSLIARPCADLQHALAAMQ